MDEAGPIVENEEALCHSDISQLTDQYSEARLWKILYTA
jgi:hypothetical protein